MLQPGSASGVSRVEHPVLSSGETLDAPLSTVHLMSRVSGAETSYRVCLATKHLALLALIFPDLSLPDVSRIPASFARFTTQLDFAALVQSSITKSRVTLRALFRLMVISWF